MARALTAVGVLLALLLGGALLLIGTSGDRQAIDPLLSERISLAAARADRLGRPLDFAAVAPFDWDRLLIIDPAAGPKTISDALGFSWPGEVAFQTGDLLVFAQGSGVARYADYRGEGGFDGVRRPVAVFDRAQARFRADGLILRPLSRASGRAR